MITVNTVSDINSAGAALSLRQAIEISNGTLDISSLTTLQQAQVQGALSTPNTISFDIPSSQGPLYDIALTSPLPAITSPVIINGYSQPGASPNSNGPGLADDAVLNVEIDGTNAGSGASGLVITTGASTIEGLVIANFGMESSGSGGNGIVLQTGGANVIAGNYIGVDPGGTAATNIAGDDILIDSGSSQNTVGGLTSAARNLLVNNNAGGSSVGAGVDIEGTSGNLVLGNFVGTDATGTESLAGGSDSIGVLIAAGATGNTVGGTTPAAGNLISGNKGSGVQIGAKSDTTATSANVVAGNDIGTDVTGLLPLGNGAGTSPAGDGVDLIGVNSIDNTVGGSVAAAGNLISANAYDGIYLNGASDATLGFNLLGADSAQNFADTRMGNSVDGIELDDAPGITIANNLAVNNKSGGIALYYPQTANDAIDDNEIILNGGDGILFCNCGSGGSTVYGNWIGTDASGTASLGNQGYGIEIGTPNNTVGGTAAGAANVIAFNTKAGIGLEQLNTDTGNTFSANSIYSNQGLGIDLGNTGVPLQNEPGGPRVGPNRLQNYPVLTSASAFRGGTTITGSLNSTANQTFTIQFFTNTTPDPSGYGEGQTYVGSTTVTTDGSGNASIGFVAPTNISGQWVSATATDASGDTSEFAQALTVTANVPTRTRIVQFGPSLALAGRALTFMAVVSAADGTMPPGSVTFLVDGHAQLPAVSLQVVGGEDVANFSLSLSTPGSHMISAQYDGGSGYAVSNSGPVKQVVQPNDGPSVVTVQWVGNKSTSTTIVLHFNEALDQGPAQTENNYIILTTGLHGQFGKGSKRIRVSSAVYNSSADTVTLHTSANLNVQKRYQLKVSGTAPNGLTGGAIFLDGAADGRPGSNHVTVLNQQNYVLNPPTKVKVKNASVVGHPKGRR